MLELRNLAFYGDYSLGCRNCNRSLLKGKSWDLYDPASKQSYQTIVCRRCGEKIMARLNRRRTTIPK